MSKHTHTLVNCAVAILCIATMYVTINHRKTTIETKNQEVASLKRQLAEAKRQVFQMQTVERAIDGAITVEAWRARGASRPAEILDTWRTSDNDNIRALVENAEIYAAGLNNKGMDVLSSGVDLMLAEILSEVRESLSSDEDLEIFESMVGSADWMEGFRSVVEVTVANQMRAMEE